MIGLTSVILELAESISIASGRFEIPMDRRISTPSYLVLLGAIKARIDCTLDSSSGLRIWNYYPTR